MYHGAFWIYYSAYVIRIENWSDIFILLSYSVFIGSFIDNVKLSDQNWFSWSNAKIGWEISDDQPSS